MTAARPRDPEFATRRAALRLFTYGLHVVTARRGDEHHGFTANFLTQVSFDPPLIALSVENDGRSIAVIRETGVFTINVLPSDAVELAGTLGRRSITDPHKLDKVAWHEGPNGRAVLEAALAFVDCEVESSAPAGDSTLFIARPVRGAVLREGVPLRMSETPYRHSG